MRVLLLLAAWIIAVPAAAFVRSVVPDSDGICLFWDQRELSWVAAPGDAPGLSLADAEAAFERSFQAWEEVACSDVSFVARGTGGERSVGFVERGPNENVVLFRDRRCEDVVSEDDGCWEDGDCGNRWDCWDFPEAVIAVTTTTFSQRTGQIVDADIEFNAAAFFFTVVDGPACRGGQTENCVSTDLANTATHEIGHLLGLDHSPVRQATMYASAPTGETSKRTLEEDDIAGLCAIYPAGESASVCVDREHLADRRSSGCGCGAGSGVGLEALLALVPLLWRRPRR